MDLNTISDMLVGIHRSILEHQRNCRPNSDPRLPGMDEIRGLSEVDGWMLTGPVGISER